MGTALRKAIKRAKRLSNINSQIDGGGELGIAARQAKKALANSWNRRDMNPGLLHNPKHLNGSVLSYGANRSHLVTSL